MLIYRSIIKYIINQAQIHDINKVLGDKNKESLEGFVEKLREALRKY